MCLSRKQQIQSILFNVFPQLIRLSFSTDFKRPLRSASWDRFFAQLTSRFDQIPAYLANLTNQLLIEKTGDDRTGSFFSC